MMATGQDWGFYMGSQLLRLYFCQFGKHSRCGWVWYTRKEKQFTWALLQTYRMKSSITGNKRRYIWQREERWREIH